MKDPSRVGEFVDRRAVIEDAKIRRCTCGSWCYGPAACGACGSFPEPVDNTSGEQARSA